MRKSVHLGDRVNCSCDLNGSDLSSGSAQFRLIKWRPGLLDSVAELHAQLCRVHDRRPDFRTRFLATHPFIHKRDLETLARFAGYKTQSWQLGCGVLNDAEIHRRVTHRPTDAALHKTRPRRRIEVSRQQTLTRRLQPEQSAMRGGYADRSAPVGAMGQRQNARRDAGRRTAARSARAVVEVPRIVRRSVKDILGAVDDSHLRHVCDAHKIESGAFGCQEKWGRFSGNIVALRSGTSCESNAGDRRVVLDQERYAPECAIS